MELKWLEDFEALATTLSFSRAAEARHVTQSAFSRRIRQLEHWLGAPLINRATIPAELTNAGREFLVIAQQTIRTLHAAREALRPAAPDLGWVRFAALHTLTVTFFPVWLEEITRRVPDLRCTIMPDRGGIEANLGALTDGEVDFFLTYAHPSVPFVLDPERFSHLSLGKEQVLPVAGKRVDFAPGRAEPGEGLLDRAIRTGKPVPYLSYGDTSFFGVALGRLFQLRPSFVRKTRHVNTIAAGLKRMALSGHGLCWLPESLVAEELATGELAKASDNPEWTAEVEVRLYRHTAPGHATVEKLWAALQARPQGRATA